MTFCTTKQNILAPSSIWNSVKRLKPPWCKVNIPWKEIKKTHFKKQRKMFSKNKTPQNVPPYQNFGWCLGFFLFLESLGTQVFSNIWQKKGAVDFATVTLLSSRIPKKQGKQVFVSNDTEKTVTSQKKIESTLFKCAETEKVEKMLSAKTTKKV